ncbi:MAG: histidine phosphatase family protein [Acholeplasmataceae bacterium]|nr:histidine phosphatase family protein [Acholeplasmataceae bacterium]
MILCLVRHGQTDWNINTLLQGRSDIPLNDTGRKQAEAVGRYLKANDSHWDLILSSPLIRAQETAKILARNLDYQKEIILVPDLVERSFGEFEGLHLNPAMYDRLDQGGHGIEEIEDLYKRARKTMEQIVHTYSVPKILIVSHAQFIKATLACYEPGFDFRFPLKNSSMNYLEAKDGIIKLQKFNITAE